MTNETMRTAAMALGVALALGSAVAKSQETPTGPTEYIKRLNAEIEQLRTVAFTVANDPANVPWGASYDVPDMDLFQLWASCTPLFPVINLNDTTEGGRVLTEESVQSAVESRLRSARLYSDEPGLILLWVDVSRFSDTSPWPFSIKLALRKLVFDIHSGTNGLARSWQSSSFGLGPPEIVRATLAEDIDNFLAEYLRVNEAACGNATE